MKHHRYCILSILFLTSLTSTAFAVDGVILIDQNRALAGSVTPGDAPGFPVTLSQPGSYRLSGSLTVPANTNGIEILADRVTLDLNGFSIVGSGSGDGISNGGVGRFGTAIRNGAVTKFQNGIQLGATNGARASSEIQQIRAIDNVSRGISVGPNAIVTGNTAIGNGFLGIAAGQNAVLSGNNASENGSGISVFLNAVINENNASSNLAAGIIVECPSNLVGNTALDNVADILTGVFSNCTFANNLPNAPIP